jgi:RNA polymerase sigma factor (sigma-70 family)
MHLRAWLYKLVRNRCLDELRRGGAAAATPALPFDEMTEASLAHGHSGDDPHEVVSRRHAVRHMLEDIAALPDRQREVLLRREVDGASHEQVASDLGITVRASKNLANRARENLARSDEARGASCTTVRDDLLAAHEQRHRASAHAHRHLAVCRDCRRFRTQLGTMRGAMRILSPGPALGGAGASVTVKLAAATALTAVATGGAVEFSQQVALPGERSPFRIQSVILAGPLDAGEPVPHGTAVLTRKLTLAAGTRRHPSIALPCPGGTRVAGLSPDHGVRVSYGYSRGTLVGSSTTARIVFAAKRLSAPAAITVGTLCKRPDATGSLLAVPAFAASKHVRRVCSARAYLFETPSQFVVGTVFRGQPVVLKRQDRTKRWARVTTDAGITGWLRSRAISRGSRCA